MTRTKRRSRGRLVRLSNRALMGGPTVGPSLEFAPPARGGPGGRAASTVFPAASGCCTVTLRMSSHWSSRVRAVTAPLAASLSLACGASSLSPAPAPAPSTSAAVAAAPPSDAVAHPNPALISRKVFFEPVVRSQVKVSPDGQRIGWLAANGSVVNVWVGPADDVKKAQPVTHNSSDEIGDWWWTFTSDRILVAQDHQGDEKWHLSAVDLTKSETKDLTAVDGVRAELVGLSPRRPREALIALNDRDKKAPDVYLVDLTTGARKLAQQNDGGANAWIADTDLHVRFAEHTNGDASVDLVVPAPGKAPWKPFQHIPMEDALALESVDFDKTGGALFLKDSRNRDTSGLFSIDTKTGAATLVADDPQSDVGQVLMHPTTKTVEAVSLDRERPVWKVVDPSVEGDFYYLQTFGDGTLLVTSRSLDEQHWIVAYAHTDGPTHFYRYDRDPDIPGNPGKATLLFNDRDDLERVPLSMMVPVVIKSRDGLDLVSYLTIPYDKDPRSEGRPQQPLPLIILVHDGPWARAVLELDATHQWLASRGYAVLSVNYRGSTGFGQKFANAGNLEWGGKMSDDLVDAVRWAVDQKIADPTRVAIMGEGYGGYAALAGLAFEGQTFACGVDFGGPANLFTFLQTVPPEGLWQTDALAHRIGDYRTEDGKKFVTDRSPSSHVATFRNPVLIGQGKDDPAVKEADTAQFVAALQAKHVPVTFAVYADEERTLTDPTDKTSFSAVAEVFLAQCFGSDYRPIGNDLDGSSIAVPVGAEAIVGLRAALAAKK